MCVLTEAPRGYKVRSWLADHFIFQGVTRFSLELTRVLLPFVCAGPGAECSGELARVLPLGGHIFRGCSGLALARGQRMVIGQRSRIAQAAHVLFLLLYSLRIFPELHTYPGLIIFSSTHRSFLCLYETLVEIFFLLSSF